MLAPGKHMLWLIPLQVVSTIVCVLCDCIANITNVDILCILNLFAFQWFDYKKLFDTQ